MDRIKSNLVSNYVTDPLSWPTRRMLHSDWSVLLTDLRKITSFRKFLRADCDAFISLYLKC